MGNLQRNQEASFIALSSYLKVPPVTALLTWSVVCECTSQTDYLDYSLHLSIIILGPLCRVYHSISKDLELYLAQCGRSVTIY